MPASAQAEAAAPPTRPGAATALLAASLVALSFARFGLGGEAFVAAFVAAVLVVLSAIDLERRILPNRIVLPSAALVLAAQSALFPDRALEWLLAALGASLFLLLPLFVNPAGMGMGDVKLALLLGAALGKGVVTALVIGFVAVVPVAAYLLLRHGTSARKAAIPFGPFLAFGALVALFLGSGGASA
jgi:leader peptidase (prepilin peptidase) / N-methyltransferase